VKRWVPSNDKSPLAHAYFAGIDAKKTCFSGLCAHRKVTLFLIRQGNLMVEGLMFVEMMGAGMMMFLEVNYRQLLK